MEEVILNKLFKLKDDKYKEFHSNLCPGTNNIIGIRIPVLRNYAKELAKENDIEKLLEIIGNTYYEEIMLKGMLIGFIKNDIETVVKYIENFVPLIDNWAVCDSFCAGLKITKKNKESMWEFIQKYANSKKEFEVRFAIVMILDYYIEDEYLDKDFEIFDNVKNNNYYVQMAVAWAVSLCMIKYYDKTSKYLKKCKLDKFTYNKSLQKARESYRITEEQKEELKKLKK